MVPAREALGLVSCASPERRPRAPGFVTSPWGLGAYEARVLGRRCLAVSSAAGPLKASARPLKASRGGAPAGRYAAWTVAVSQPRPSSSRETPPLKTVLVRP